MEKFLILCGSYEHVIMCLTQVVEFGSLVELGCYPLVFYIELLLILRIDSVE